MGQNIVGYDSRDKQVMSQRGKYVVCEWILLCFAFCVLRTTLAGFGKWPCERSVPNSARRRASGANYNGL